MKTHTIVEIQENPDKELFFELPADLLGTLDWKEGDNLKFIDNKNGSFHLKKVKYSTIEIDFGDDELLRYMTYAHERGMTFNELVEDCIKDFLIKADFENDEI